MSEARDLEKCFFSGNLFKGPGEVLVYFPGPFSPPPLPKGWRGRINSSIIIKKNIDFLVRVKKCLLNMIYNHLNLRIGEPTLFLSNTLRLNNDVSPPTLIIGHCENSNFVTLIKIHIAM